MAIARSMALILKVSILIFLLFSCSPGKYTVINKGVGGNSTTDLLKRMDKDVLDLRPDIVIVMAGTNDMVNSRKFATYETFTSNYEAIIKKLQAQRIEVIVMNILPVDTTYLFQRHDRKSFDQLPNQKIDAANQLVLRIAEQYSVPFVDLNSAFSETGSPHPDASSLIMNVKNSGKEDGIHPTREGYRLIAENVYRMLKKEKLLKKKRTIVCFGDSITFGAYMEGAGTADGNTYPGFLKNMLAGEL